MSWIWAMITRGCIGLLAIHLLLVSSMAWSTPAHAMPAAPQTGNHSVVLTLIADRPTVAPGDAYTVSLTFFRRTADAVAIVITNDHQWISVRTVQTPAGVQCRVQASEIRCDLPDPAPTLGTITFMVDVRAATPPATLLRHEAAWFLGIITAPVVTAVVRVQGAPVTPTPTAPPPAYPPPITPAPTQPPSPSPTIAPPITTTPAPSTSGPLCTSQPLVEVPGVRAPNPRLNALAAASFTQVRQEILAATGQDVLAVLADVLRHPSFRPNKPGVARRSWHMAGRAIDLNLGGPFTLRPDGAMFRVYVGTVDITAIFERHGWSRIPRQGDVLEWWHYEYHPDGISWESAMVQVWPMETLRTAFPEINWSTVGCTTGPGLPSSGGTDGTPLADGVCTPELPVWADAPGVQYVRGCGPPVEPPSGIWPTGTRLRQFTGVVGWIGQTGRLIPPGAAGGHLHLGLDLGMTTDVCRWPFQPPGVPEGQPPPGGWSCVTTWVDPVQFLPQANGDTLATVNGTPVPRSVATAVSADGSWSDAPLQLPPPGHPAATWFETPDGETGVWWSPGNVDRANGAPGALGGPAVTTWLRQLWCALFGWLTQSGCRAP